MVRPFEVTPASTDVVLRAMAISAVAYHHAHLGNTGQFGLGGGMTFLLMLSGLNFARFGLRNATPAGVRQSIFEFARQLWIPSVVLVLFSFAIYRQFSWPELLFIRNWWDTKHIAVFYDWYPQVLLQLLAVLYAFFSIPSAAKAALRYPLRAAVILFAAGLLLRALGPLAWDTSYLRHQIPHGMLWNFALGCAVYFLAFDPATSSRAKRWLAVVCVLAGAAVAHSPAKLPFWWLIIGGCLLVAVKEIRLPRVLANGVLIVSSASFTIFLTHLLWFKLLNKAYGLWAGSGAVLPGDLLFGLGWTMSVAGWVAFSAFVRVYRTARLPSASLRFAE